MRIKLLPDLYEVDRPPTALTTTVETPTGSLLPLLLPNQLPQHVTRTTSMEPSVTRPPFPNDGDVSSTSTEQTNHPRPMSLPGATDPQTAPVSDVTSLATLFRSLNLERDPGQMPPEIQQEIVAALARWDSMERAHLEVPRPQPSTTGASTPPSGHGTPIPGRQPPRMPPPPRPILNPHPQPGVTPSSLVTDKPVIDIDVLPYVHSVDRIDVNKMLTEAERRIGLFEKATPSRPTYFPPPDPQYQINFAYLTKNRVLDIKHGKFSGNAKDYDDWAEKIADHWATRHRTWSNYVLPEELKISETAEQLDDQKRKTWNRMRNLPISDKGKLFTLREYLIYFRTYWGQRKDTITEHGVWVSLKQTGSAQAFIRTVRQKALELNPPAEMREIVRVISGGLKKEILKAVAQQPNAPDAYTATEEWLDWIIKLDQAAYTHSRPRDRFNAVDTDPDDQPSPSDTDDEDDDDTELVNAVRGLLKTRGKRSGKNNKTKRNKGKPRKRSRRRSASSRSRSTSPEETRKCYYCQEPGHLVRNCHKRKKDEKEKKQKEKEEKEKKGKKKKDSSDSDSSSSKK